MRKVKALEQPKSILWIAAGNPINESTIGVYSILAESVSQAFPNIRQVLYTNSLTHPKFPFDTYHVDRTTGLCLAEQSTLVTISAWQEGELDMADLIIANTEMSVMFIALLGLEYVGAEKWMGAMWRQSPVIMTPIQISYDGEALSGEIEQSYAKSVFWGMMARAYPHLSIATFDNDHHLALAKKAYRENAPECIDVPVRKFIYYQYAGQLVRGVRKDKVIWSGRCNPVKNPQFGIDVLRKLDALGVEVRMYMPSGKPRLLEKMLHQFCEHIVVGLGTDDYLKQVSDAKVVVTSSLTEGFPAGYLELAERGVVPLLPDRTWSKAFLGDDYPFIYKNENDATAIALYVLAHYEECVEKLDQAMRKRFSEPPNFVSIIKDVWRDWREVYQTRKLIVDETEIRGNDARDNSSE